MRPPAVPRIVALGDVAHTTDPSGGGGMTFALLEAELLDIYAPRWLGENDCSPAAIERFYTDQRRERRPVLL
jgi:2-polyprenyl-6-methoxyphenol hydroxylase-like FAD-dependent oxidoreductase